MSEDARMRLREALERVERERVVRVAQLRDEWRRNHGNADPPDDGVWQEYHGRSILLDADVALVNGWAALVRAEDADA